MYEPSIESLVGAVGKESFLTAYWKKRPLFLEGSDEKLSRLVEDIGSLDLASLLARGRQLMIWVDRSKQDRDGAPGAPALPPSIDVALDHYYNHGSTLYFTLPEDSVVHRRWVTPLRQELGEPRGRVSIFAVRAKKGSVAHYDRNENFTIQLRGTKTWRLAPSAAFVQEPDGYWEVGPQPPPHAHGKPTPAMPEDAEVHVLRPGSLLYVPRGHLHQVTAEDEDCMQLNLNFPNVLWGEAMMAILGKRLSAHVVARRAVTGAFGSRWNRASARSTLEESRALLAKVCADLADEDLEALFEELFR